MLSKISVRYLLEPLVLFYIFANVSQSPLISQYVYKVYSDDVNFEYEYTNDSSTCGKTIKNLSQQMLQNQVQTTVARFNIGLSFCWAVTTIIACLCYGVLSDTFGRKTFLVINCVGATLDSVLYLLVMILELPVELVYVGIAINGICGGYMGLNMICYAYLADVCESDDLPKRIATFEATSLVASCLSFYASGPLIQRYGFIIPQILMLVLFCMSTVYILFILKESLPNKITPEESKEPLMQNEKSVNKHVTKKSKYRFVWKELKQQLGILFGVLSRGRPKRWALYHSIAILTLVSCFTNGLYNITVLYLMNRPFCFPPLDVGIYLGTQLAMVALGTLFGTYVLLRFMPKYLVTMLSPFSAVISYIMIPIAKTKTVIYGAVVVRGFSSMHTPIFRSTLSGIVDDTEQGSIFSVVIVLDTLAQFIASFVFNFTYSEMNSSGKAGFFWLRWRKEDNDDAS